MNEQVEIAPQDKWRSGYLRSLLRQHQDAKYLMLEDKMVETQDLIDSLAV